MRTHRPSSVSSPGPLAAGQVKLDEMPDVAGMVAALGRAKISIDLSCYLITDAKIIAALEAAAERGVKVRVMEEPKPVEKGSANFPALEKALEKAGISVLPTPPIFDSADDVDHAKFFVVDGKDLWVGSGNLVKSSLEGDESKDSDRDFWLEDDRTANVTGAEGIFQADWARQQSKSVRLGTLLATPDNAEAGLLDFIGAAKTSLLVYNQELTDARVIAALLAAKKRGVDVQVLVASPESKGETDINAPALKQLEAAKVTVGEMAAPHLHAKAMVADGDNVYVGSQNFSIDGVFRNRELGDVVQSTDLARQLTADFHGDQKLTS